MAQELDVQSTPNVTAAVNVPDVVHNFDTNTGPQAQPQAFGANLGGLVQGMESATDSLHQAGREVRANAEQMKNAQSELWATQQHVNLDNQASTWLEAQRVAGKPADPDAFQSWFGQQSDQISAKAPDQYAQIAFQKGAAMMGGEFYKQNLAANAAQMVQQRDTYRVNALNAITQKVKVGAMSPDDGHAAVNALANIYSKANPGAPTGADDAHAAIVGTGLEQMVDKLGAGAGAKALNNGYGAPYIRPIDAVSGATDLENQQSLTMDARLTVAQQRVNRLQAAAAKGSFVDPKNSVAAANELAAAKTAQPIQTDAPDLILTIQGAADDEAKLAEQMTGPGGEEAMRAHQMIDSAQMGHLIQSRFALMSPQDQQNEVSRMADQLGPDNPYTRHASDIMEKNVERLTPGKETYDPAGMAMNVPIVLNSTNNAAKTGQPADMETATALNFAAQRRLGVNPGNEVVLTAAQAKQSADQFTGTDPNTGLSTAPAFIAKMEQQYSFDPKLATRAIQQVATASKTQNGGLMFGLLNPDNNELWSAVNFKLNKADSKTGSPDGTGTPSQEANAKVVRAINGSQEWQDYWKSQQNDTGAPQRREAMEAAMTGGMVRYYMNKTGDEAGAVKQLIQDTVGYAHQVIPDADGHTVAVPRAIADNPDAAKAEQSKANMALGSLLDTYGVQADPRGIQDNATMTHEALAQGYWSFSTQNNAWVRRIDDAASGSKVVMLGNGQPLMIDADKLKQMGSTAAPSTPGVLGWLGMHDGEAKLNGKVDATLLKTPAGYVQPIQQAASDWINYRPAPNGLPQAENPISTFDPSKPMSNTNRLPRALPVGPGDVDQSMMPQSTPAPSSVALTVPQAAAPEPAPALSTSAPKGSFEDNLPAPLKPLSGVFARFGAQYGVSPAVLAAISMHETGNGTSRAFLEGHNAMGVSNSKGPISFADARQSIQHMAMMIGKSPLYAKFRQTHNLADLASVYAPVGAENDPRGLNGDWYGGVSKFYKQLSGAM